MEEDEEDLRTLKVQKTSEELHCPSLSASARVRHQKEQKVVAFSPPTVSGSHQ